MNHHNQLDRFASRGLKAQQAVDDVLEKLPSERLAQSSGGTASGPAAGGTRGVGATTGPGASDKRRPGPVINPKSKVQGEGIAFPVEDVRAAIEESDDQIFLRRMMTNADAPVKLRQAAQGRLRKLVKRPKF